MANNSQHVNDEEQSEWKLTDIYQSPDCLEIKRDIQEITNMSKHFQKYQEFLEICNIKQAIIDYEKILTISKKLSVYAFLYSVTRLDDEEANAFHQNIIEQLTELSAKTVFFERKITDLDKDILLNYIHNDEMLRNYALFFENIFNDKDHLLKVETENALLQKSIPSLESWVRLYNEIMARINITYKKQNHNLTQMMEIVNHDLNPKKR